MKNRTRWIVAALALALLLAALARVLLSRRAAQAQVQAQQASLAQPAVLQLQPGDVLTIQPRNLAQQVQVDGSLQALHSAWVKARASGELQGLRVREGDWVQAGTVLARIEPLESDARLRQAREQTRAAQAQLDLAERSHANNRALLDRGFVSPTALQSSQSTLDAARANLAAAQAGVDLGVKALADTQVRAPLDGAVAQRLVQDGERVSVETRLLELVDTRRFELQASVNPADARNLRVGQAASVQVEGWPEPLSAQVARIAPSVTAGSRAVQVYLSLPPSQGLRQGLYASAQVQVGTRQVLALPLEAVRTDQPRPYVQRLIQGQVQHSPVQTGLRSLIDGQTWVEVQGLEAGAQILAGRVGTLRVATPVQIQSAAGH